MIVNIRHTGIVVSNMAKALDFWSAFTGFEIVIDQIEQGPFIDNLLGIENVIVRTVKMKTESGNCLELLEFQSHPLQIPSNLQPNTLGITHIALTVSDLNLTLSNLKSMGYVPFGEPRKSQDEKVKVVYIRVFEGVLLELVQEFS